MLDILEEPVLVIFGGLPCSGKTTVSRELARRIGAVYLRIDTIETAMTKSEYLQIKRAEDVGYLVAYDVAIDNLNLGYSVIGDSVNPIAITRDAWRETANKIGKKFIEIEVFCSDQSEHKRRLEARNADIKGDTPPLTWEQVQKREYHDWDPTLKLDTSKLSTEECVEKIIEVL